MSNEKQRVTYTTSIDADLKKEFKIKCAEKGVQMNDVIEMLITNWLDKEGGKDGNTDQHR